MSDINEDIPRNSASVWGAGHGPLEVYNWWTWGFGATAGCKGWSQSTWSWIPGRSVLLMHIESYAISKKDGLKGKAPEGPKIYWKQEKNFDRCDFPVSLLTLLGHNGHFIADRSWHRPPSCRGLRKMLMPLGRCKKGTKSWVGDQMVWTKCHDAEHYFWGGCRNRSHQSSSRCQCSFRRMFKLFAANFLSMIHELSDLCILFNLPHFSRMICRYLPHQLNCAGAEPPETPLDIAKGLLDATDPGELCVCNVISTRSWISMELDVPICCCKWVVIRRMPKHALRLEMFSQEFTDNCLDQNSI